MTIAVEFHNQVYIHPGAISYVDVSGMVTGGVDERKVAGIVAEAPYGRPGLHVFADSNEAKLEFGPSEAADLVQMLMDPSNDEDIDGAELVYVYKPNRTQRANRYLLRNPDRAQAIATSFAVAASGLRDLTSDPIVPAYIEIVGNFAENNFANLVVEVIGGTGKGQQRWVASSVDNGANHRFNLSDTQDWATLPLAAGGAPSTIRVGVPMIGLQHTTYGTPGNRQEVEFGREWSQESYALQSRIRNKIVVQKDPVGGTRKPIFWLKFDPTGGGTASQWTDPTNWVIPQAQNGDPVAIEGTSTVLSRTILSDAPTLTGDHADKWVLITGPTTSPDYGKLFKVVSNTTGDSGTGGAGTDDLVLAYPGLSQIPAASIQYKLMQLGDSYIEVDGEDGVAKTLKVINRIWDPAAGPAAWVEQTYISVDLTLFTTLDALADKLNEMDGITAVVGDGVDPDASSQQFDFGVMSDHHGRDRSSKLIAGGGEAAGSTSLELERSDNFPSTAGGVTYYAIVAPGTSKEEFVLVSTNTTATDVLTTSALVNSHAQYTDIKFLRGSSLIKGPNEVTDKGFPVKNNVQQVIDWINANVGSFSAYRPTGPASGGVAQATYATYKSQVGGGVPEDCNDIWKFFWGGEAGTSIVSKPTNEADPFYPYSWEDGFDRLLMQQDIRVVVPAVSMDKPNWNTGDILTVLDLLENHVNDADENGRAERHGYMGLAYPLEAGTFGGVAFTQGLLDLIREKNNPRLSISGQQTSIRSNSRNAQTLLDEWGFAGQVAGVHMGTPIGEPATLKYIRTSALSQRYNDWDPKKILDQKKALRGRLLYGEAYKSRWRIVRHFSTHVQDENLALTDANVWDVRNELKRGGREMMEERFGGRGIGVQRPGIRESGVASVPNMREAMGTWLEEKRKDGIIVDSQDDNEQWIHAWHSLYCTINADVGRVRVAAFPKTGMNFILLDFTFQLPRQSG